MWDKLQNETLPADYIMSELTPPDIDNFVISIRTEKLNIENGLPVIKLNLTIYSDLHYKMHVCNTEIPSSKASKLTNKSGICGSTTEVLNILALLKTLTVDSIGEGGGRHRSKKSAISVWFFSERSSKSHGRS